MQSAHTRTECVTETACDKGLVTIRLMILANQDHRRKASCIPGDVILSRGSHIIARLIIEFGAGEYSHSAMYLGDGDVLESIADGLRRRSLKESIAAHNLPYVDAFRFISLTHIVLDRGLAL